MNRFFVVTILSLSTLPVFAADVPDIKNEHKKLSRELRHCCHIGHMPYKDPAIDDVVFWRATLRGDLKQPEGIEIHIIAGAKTFIEYLKIGYLKKKYEPYRHKSVSKLINKVAKQYVTIKNFIPLKGDYNDEYIRRLKQVESGSLKYSMGRSYPKVKDGGDLVCPELAQKASESILAFPSEEGISVGRYCFFLEKYLIAENHEGSYAASKNLNLVNRFLDDRKKEEAYAKSGETGWVAFDMCEYESFVQISQQ